MKKVKRIRELTSILNAARNEYYNKSTSVMSDLEYDNLFDELQLLENETKIILSNSPTQEVGYTVQSKLEKVVHKYPLLSLDKTKDINVVRDFSKGRDALLMLKLDGLTICLTYEDGKLILAETRGNGIQGENIVSNAKTFGIPLTIPQTDRLIITGEAIITYKWFEYINSKLSEEDKYKTPRNLASGSVRQLDSKVCKYRHVEFVAFNVQEGIEDNSLFMRLKTVEKYGFTIVPMWTYSPSSKDYDNIQDMIDNLKEQASQLGYPIDGMVMMLDDLVYGASLGKTSHHFLNGLAFKFYDELSETTLLDIEWSPSRTGLLNPVAIFEPVEIDGTTVTRASLSNLSIMEDLELGIGDLIQVSKRNMIIPKVEDNLTRSFTITYPLTCPICGELTHIKKDNNTKVITCTNPDCKGKLLGKLTHFVSKPAMNIDGMSESTIEFLIDKGWVNTFADMYTLSNYKSEWMRSDGFGKTSVDKLLEAIEKSRNVKLENLLVALGIPLIGKTASKDISKFCNGYSCEFGEYVNNNFDFSKAIDGFGSVMNSSLYEWLDNNNDAIVDLREELVIIRDEISTDNNSVSLEGLIFVITGSVNKFKNRDELKEKIESLQGKVSGSVSKNTSYLINNDNHSTSGKNKKAHELGVKIITEEEFIEIMNI